MIFRYPGGKSRLAKHILPFIDPTVESCGRFADPFVGGGSILLEVARRFPDIDLVANDADSNIAAFWQMVSGHGDGNELARLLSQQPTISLFRELRNRTPETIEERAYRGVFFNRTTFSGIARSGPIGGYETQGTTKWTVDCRYNAERLVREFWELRRLLDGRLVSTSRNALDLLPELSDWALYLDPPYYEKGAQLYTVAMEDAEHAAMAGLLQARKNWALSYDDHERIRQLYAFARIASDLEPRYSIDGFKTAWKRKHELLIVPHGLEARRLFDD